uniref:Uncharacterized protein n=1 Tax=Arundo donax TaxID=35708 RepID=A0A0A9EGF0_ARUDO
MTKQTRLEELVHVANNGQTSRGKELHKRIFSSFLSSFCSTMIKSNK